MLMVMDVGNTNITLGVFDGEELLITFRMTTKIPRTSDEYGIIIRDMLLHIPVKRTKCHSDDEDTGSPTHFLMDESSHGYNGKQIHVNDIQAVIISSVVPNVMHSLTSAIIKYFQITPIIVGPGTKTGIRIATENPRQIGADRIVDAVGGYMLYGGPVIVIDYGTATTYDLVSESGSFEAGVIVPGIRTSVKTLWEDAAKLPEIEIRKPKSILARETITSMQAGLVYGQIGQTEYIISHIKQESGYSNIKVVATGGLGKLIASETKYIDIYDPNLTLHGMRLIYEKQRQ